MIPGCFVTASKRGLCARCHARAKAKVDTGETTWELLVKRGLCKQEKDPFDSAYEQAVKNEYDKARLMRGHRRLSGEDVPVPGEDK